MLPLIVNGKPFGVLYIYSEEADAFDSAEVELLEELAGDLAFGIIAIRTREEKNRAERALLDNEERTRTIVDSAYDGIISIDEQGTIKSMNLAALEMFGYASEEILGENVTKLMPETYRDSHTAGLARHIESGRGKTMGIDIEVEGLRKDGTVFPMMIVRKETQSGNRRILFGTVRDMTERKEAEKALQRVQEMIVRSEKLSSIGTLTAGAAHEILNPANIIGMHAQLLLRQSEEGSSEYKAAEVIYRNVERINLICDNLCRFSRDEAPEFGPFEPNKIVKDSLNLVLHELRLLNIHHELILSNGPAKVIGDSHQIQQVLFNLIGDAKDAMPSGGNLTITTSEVVEEDERWWECWVKDTGIGIPKEILPKLFDPFFTTKPEDKETGLGLSVSFGVVESHSGKIWVESDEGQGATFVIRLPLEEEP